VCDEVVAVDWHEKTKQHLKVIDVKRPRQDVLKIHLPVIENDVEEDSSIYDFIAQKKVESIMSYVIQEILKDYYFGIDECFHPRKQKTALQAEEEKVVFIMREMIDGIYRTSPIKIKTHYDKESKQVSYTDWNP
jgi:hypothetical protein